MPCSKDDFIQAIHDRKKVRLTFFSQEDRCHLTRVCAPMDFGPGRKIHDGIDRFWVWDYESDTGKHTLPLRHERIQTMTVLDDVFDPAEFVTWTPAWIVPRDWGQCS
jgi:hypothetical protein